MVSVLISPKGRYCLLDRDGELGFESKKHNPLIKRINDDYLECQRVYLPSEDQEKEGYQALTLEEQEAIENQLSQYERIENSPGHDSSEE